MNPQSLLISSDDKTTRTLRRVLGELEIGVEHWPDADSAICCLTRHRFEAVIVDCNDENACARLLASLRLAPGNKHAIAAVVIDSRSEAQRNLANEADLVLYKPLSFIQAKCRFRAVRYLMKCERRRNKRVPIEIPVTLISDTGKAECRTVTSDISEKGMAVWLPRRFKRSSLTRVRFTLPGTNHAVESTVEVAWENSQSEAGFRFMDLSRGDRANLKAWLDPYCFDFQPAGPAIPGNLIQPAHSAYAPARG